MVFFPEIGTPRPSTPLDCEVGGRSLKPQSPEPEGLWRTFRERWLGLFQTAGQVVGTSLFSRIVQPLLLTGVQFLGVRGHFASLVFSSIALSSLISGGMALFSSQPDASGSPNRLEALRNGLAYALPSSLLGTGLLCRLGPSMNFLHNLFLVEPAQAAVATCVGKGLEPCEDKPQEMGLWERYKGQLVQGILFMGFGRFLGGGFNLFPFGHLMMMAGPRHQVPQSPDGTNSRRIRRIRPHRIEEGRECIRVALREMANDVVAARKGRRPPVRPHHVAIRARAIHPRLFPRSQPISLRPFISLVSEEGNYPEIVASLRKVGIRKLERREPLRPHREFGQCLEEVLAPPLGSRLKVLGEIATKADINRETLSCILKGRMLPTPKTLFNICSTLGDKLDPKRRARLYQLYNSNILNLTFYDRTDGIYYIDLPEGVSFDTMYRTPFALFLSERLSARRQSVKEAAQTMDIDAKYLWAILSGNCLPRKAGSLESIAQGTNRPYSLVYFMTHKEMLPCVTIVDRATGEVLSSPTDHTFDFETLERTLKPVARTSQERFFFFSAIRDHSQSKRESAWRYLHWDRKTGEVSLTLPPGWTPEQIDEVNLAKLRKLRPLSKRTSKKIRNKCVPSPAEISVASQRWDRPEEVILVKMWTELTKTKNVTLKTSAEGSSGPIGPRAPLVLMASSGRIPSTRDRVEHLLQVFASSGKADVRTAAHEELIEIAGNDESLRGWITDQCGEITSRRMEELERRIATETDALSSTLTSAQERRQRRIEALREINERLDQPPPLIGKPKQKAKQVTAPTARVGSKAPLSDEFCQAAASFRRGVLETNWETLSREDVTQRFRDSLDTLRSAITTSDRPAFRGALEQSYATLHHVVHGDYPMPLRSIRPFAELTGLQASTIYLLSRADQIPPNVGLDVLGGSLSVDPIGFSGNNIVTLKTRAPDELRRVKEGRSWGEAARDWELAPDFLSRISKKGLAEWVTDERILKLEKALRRPGHLWVSLSWEELRQFRVKVIFKSPGPQTV